MPESLPSSPEYKDFQQQACGIDADLPSKIDKALSQTPLFEAQALNTLLFEDPKFIEEWYDSFYTDLEEAAQENLAGVKKLQDFERRTQSIIDNKLRELANRYFRSDESLSKPETTPQEKKFAETLRPTYETARYYMALFAALGVNPQSLTDMEQLCSRETQPTKEELQKIEKFKLSTVLVGSIKSCQQILEVLENNGFPDIDALVQTEKGKLQALVTRFLNNPTDISEKDIEELGKTFLHLQNEFQRAIEMEQRQTYDDTQKEATKIELIKTLKFGADIIGTLCIPYYSTAKLLYTSYQTGTFDKKDFLMTLAIDTAFALPVTRVLGLAAKGGGKLVKATRIAQRGEKLAKLVVANRAYTAMNIAGTGIVTVLAGTEAYQQVKAELESIATTGNVTNEVREHVKLLALSVGYIVWEVATAKYTLNKHLPLNIRRLLLECVDEIFENPKTAQELARE